MREAGEVARAGPGQEGTVVPMAFGEFLHRTKIRNGPLSLPPGLRSVFMSGNAVQEG